MDDALRLAPTSPENTPPNKTIGGVTACRDAGPMGNTRAHTQQASKQANHYQLLTTTDNDYYQLPTTTDNTYCLLLQTTTTDTAAYRAHARRKRVHCRHPLTRSCTHLLPKEWLRVREWALVAHRQPLAQEHRMAQKEAPPGFGRECSPFWLV